MRPESQGVALGWYVEPLQGRMRNAQTARARGAARYDAH